MKILMVQTFYFHRGGDSTYMLNLSDLLTENGHEVVHFAMKHPQNLPSPYSDYFVSEIDFPGLLAERSPKAAWTVAARSIFSREARENIARLADATKPDIAHFHNIHGHLTTSIIKPLRDRGIPIVWTLHDYRQVCPNTSMLSHGEICDRCLPNKFYNVVLHRCKKGSLAASVVAMLSMYYERLTRVPDRIARFITPSGFLRSKLIQGHFDPEKIETIPNFVDLVRFRPEPEGEHYLYIGRLSYEKGIDVLIRAAASLDTGRLFIVGEGPVENELRALAGRVGAGRVEFLGFRSGEELEHLIARSQFVVLPSRWYENLPFSIMEAFASGKPVIATDLGGIPEMVEDGVNGFLFPNGDVKALTERIRRLLSDHALRAEMGKRAREKAERLYNRETHYEKVMKVYEKVRGGA